MATKTKTENEEPITNIAISMPEGATDADRLYKQENLVNAIIKDFEIWQNWRKPWETMWLEVYKLYINFVKEHKIPTRAKVFVPIVFQVVEAAMPKLISIIFGQDDFFDIKTGDKDKESIPILKVLLQEELELSKVFIKSLDFLKQLLIYGTSYFLVYWKVKRDWVYVRTPNRTDKTVFGIVIGKNELSWDKKLEYAVTERRPEVEVLDIADVYPDPTARTVGEGRGIFVRSVMSRSDVQEMGAGKFPAYDNTDKIEANQNSTSLADNNIMSDKRGAIRGLPSGFRDKDEVEILTFWGKYDLDGDGIKEECQIVIANRKILLKAVRNPFDHQQRPIIRSTLFNVPMEWFGIGLIEPVISLQHELNTLRRQRLDNINLILNRMWKVDSLADVDLDSLISSPDGVILTDNMDAVEPLATPDVTASAYNDAAVIQQDIENTTAPRSVQGTPESGKLGRTARGAELIISQALEKFGLSARVTEESAFKKLLWFFHELNQQFLDKDEYFSEGGLYGHLFAIPPIPEQINVKATFEMLGVAETTKREAVINQLYSFSSVFGPLFGANLTFVAKKVWGLMGFDDKEFPSEMSPELLSSPMPDLTGQIGQNGASAPASVPGVVTNG
jgi:hypothetical protein